MGTVLEIPAISTAVFVLPRLGIGPGVAAPAMTVVRMTSLFAGLPALITSGGIGRLAAYESVKRRRRAAIGWAAGVHALAGGLLTMIAALPHGYLPSGPLEWGVLGMVGMVAGALCGAVIGVACTGAPPRQVAEMIELVKRPGLTLRQLIESEDLGRIGAAVRNRASLMFDGLLDPAEPRPAEEPREPGEADAAAGGEDDGDRAASMDGAEAGGAEAGGQETGGQETGGAEAGGPEAGEEVAVVRAEAETGVEGERRGTGEPRA